MPRLLRVSACLLVLVVSLGLEPVATPRRSDVNVPLPGVTIPLPTVVGDIVTPEPKPATVTAPRPTFRLTPSPAPRWNGESPTPPLATPTPAGPLPTAPAYLPPLQIVNKKSAKLSFGVDGVGPSGVGSVEVYVTTDEGESWKEVGKKDVTLPIAGDPRQRGSVRIDLPKEAVVYGFRVAVKSRAGLAAPAPKAGDLPHVRVESDVSKPTAELYMPQSDPARPDTVILTWKVEDRNLTAAPIVLEWSANGSEWQPIGDTAMPNTGRYLWKIREELPARVHLRLTARDSAGNVATAESADPVLIDLRTPRVIDVVVEK